jgi:hypothetical protein
MTATELEQALGSYSKMYDRDPKSKIGRHGVRLDASG